MSNQTKADIDRTRQAVEVILAQVMLDLRNQLAQLEIALPRNHASTLTHARGSIAALAGEISYALKMAADETKE